DRAICEGAHDRLALLCRQPSVDEREAHAAERPAREVLRDLAGGDAELVLVTGAVPADAGTDDERLLAGGHALAKPLPDLRQRLRAPPTLEVRSPSDGPPSAKSAPVERKCCPASSSVGAMSAACAPDATAMRAASAATTVFPDPTSPSSSRDIGIVRSRSRRI